MKVLLRISKFIAAISCRDNELGLAEGRRYTKNDVPMKVSKVN